MSKISDEEILDALKRNPDLVKEIIQEMLGSARIHNNKILNEELFNELGEHFKFDNYPKQHRIRECISSIMRCCVGIKATKMISEVNVGRARSFYKEIIALMLKYKNGEDLNDNK